MLFPLFQRPVVGLAGTQTGNFGKLDDLPNGLKWREAVGAQCRIDLITVKRQCRKERDDGCVVRA